MSPFSSRSATSSTVGGASPTWHMRGRPTILLIFFASLTGVTPQELRMTPLARNLMPTMTSLLFWITSTIRSGSIERASINSVTCFEATSPGDPRLSNAKTIWFCCWLGFQINSRKPWKLASPADPASTTVVTPLAAPAWFIITPRSVPPYQTWACRSVQPGDR